MLLAKAIPRYSIQQLNFQWSTRNTQQECFSHRYQKRHNQSNLSTLEVKFCVRVLSSPFHKHNTQAGKEPRVNINSRVKLALRSLPEVYT